MAPMISIQSRIIIWLGSISSQSRARTKLCSVQERSKYRSVRALASATRFRQELFPSLSLSLRQKLNDLTHLFINFQHSGVINEKS